MELINHKGITNYLTILKALEYEGSSSMETQARRDCFEHAKRLSQQSLSGVVRHRLIKTYTDFFPDIKDPLINGVERIINGKERLEFIKNHQETLDRFKKKYQKTKDPKLGKAFFDYYKSYIKKFIEFEGISYKIYLRKYSSPSNRPPHEIEECRKIMTYLVKRMLQNGQRKHIPNLFTLHKHFLISEQTLLNLI